MLLASATATRNFGWHYFAEAELLKSETLQCIFNRMLRYYISHSTQRLPSPHLPLLSTLALKFNKQLTKSKQTAENVNKQLTDINI